MEMRNIQWIFVKDVKTDELVKEFHQKSPDKLKENASKTNKRRIKKKKILLIDQKSSITLKTNYLTEIVLIKSLTLNEHPKRIRYIP
jgi:hypothetical protein